MPRKNTTIENEKQLAIEIKSMASQLQKFKKLDYIKIFKQPKKFFLFSLLHGVLVGLGSVIGATLGFAIFIYILTQISLVPIIGSYVERVLEEINLEQLNTKDNKNNNGIKTEEIQIINNETNEAKSLEGTYVTPVSATIPEYEEETETDTQAEQ